VFIRWYKEKDFADRVLRREDWKDVVQIVDTFHDGAPPTIYQIKTWMPTGLPLHWFSSMHSLDRNAYSKIRSAVALQVDASFIRPIIVLPFLMTNLKKGKGLPKTVSLHSRCMNRIRLQTKSSRHQNHPYEYGIMIASFKKRKSADLIWLIR
jgi:hypothetical protein